MGIREKIEQRMRELLWEEAQSRVKKKVKSFLQFPSFRKKNVDLLAKNYLRQNNENDHTMTGVIEHFTIHFSNAFVQLIGTTTEKKSIFAARVGEEEEFQAEAETAAEESSENEENTKA